MDAGSDAVSGEAFHIVALLTVSKLPVNHSELHVTVVSSIIRIESPAFGSMYTWDVAGALPCDALVVPRLVGTPRLVSVVLPHTLPMRVIFTSGLGNSRQVTLAYWGVKVGSKSATKSPGSDWRVATGSMNNCGRT